MRAARLSVLVIVLLCGGRLPGGEARAERPFPLVPGLEDAVEFWKLILTRYRGSELVFHDSLDPKTIYKVIDVGETSNRHLRRLIEAEKRKIVIEYGLEDGRRVRAQRGVRERFMEGLRLSGKYLDQIQAILREHDLPVELGYLPLIESSFNVHARSPAGAVGIWQFMRATGRRYLRISRYIDERKDPLESTRAAARFLKENYDLFGSWPLAVTAYNHGTEGILRAVSQVGSYDLAEIIQRYQAPSFGFASKSFYAEFLAAIEIAEKAKEFFPGLELHSPLRLEELELKRPIAVSALLRRMGIPRKEFFDWNPALSPTLASVPAGYRVKIASEKLEPFLASYGHVVNASFVQLAAGGLPALDGNVHRVAPGETLSEIAARYGTTVPEIQQLNGLRSVHRIGAGQYLKIPGR